MPHRAWQDARLRILLIEDDASHAALIEQNLGVIRQPRIDLEHAESLEAGLTRLATESVDAVLLDVNLPDSRGIATVERVVAAAADLPIIVLTAMDDDQVATLALRLGVEDYLVKTQLSPGLLSRSIRYAIERKRYRRELERYASRLERINRELEEFAHVVSHELKTPLWVINFALDTIMRDAGPSLGEETTKMACNARQAVQQAGGVIKSLLAYAKVTEPTARIESVDAGDALTDARAALSVMIENSGARIDHDPLPRVMANKGQLTHVLRNLIENAIKYRAERPPQVTITVRPVNEQWEFSVSDNGIGIDPKFAPRAFNMFERGASDGAGSGIGLAICKRIIERHGGRIWIAPPRDQGACICFTLTRAEPQPVDEAPAAVAAAAANAR